MASLSTSPSSALRERFIQVDRLRVRYFDEGGGTPTLLLHGASLGSSADVWSPTMADFADAGLRAIAPDLPGFGMSDNPDDHSVGFRTQFVARFMAALDLERAHVVGHSQSGRIAVSLALGDSQRLGKIVIVGTASLLPPLPGALKGEGEGEEGGASEPTFEESRRTLRKNVFNPDLVTEEAVELRHRMSLGKNFEAFRKRQETKGRENSKQSAPLWQRLPEVTVPMRLVYGRQDRDAAERALLARQRHPGIDLHLIDRCGHLVMWDARQEFVTLAAGFLTSP
jgi:pimeloyl-ACP methyl ester carboxylesterase